MSQSLLTDTPHQTQVAVTTRQAVSGRLFATGLVIALAHLPLLVLHGQHLWEREHYQFFPLLLPAAYVLAYRNMCALGSLTPGRRSASLALFGMAIAILTLGIMIHSPWLGAVAAQITLLAVAFSVGGRMIAGCLLPAWLLMFLAIPLPFSLDGWLIAELQQLSSIGASHVLEVAGVLHAREGNVLDLGDHKILVEEACSGVHSFFSVFSCTLFWSIWTRRPAGHAVLLLLAVLPWVLAGNVTRIVTVATLDDVGGINLSSGWGHEALGLCLFAAMFGLIWSTDHLFLLLTRLIQTLWHNWSHRAKSMVEEEADDVDEIAFPAQPPAAAAGTEPTRLPPFTATTLSAWPILACYGMLAIAEAGLLSSQVRGFSHTFLAPVALPADTIQAIETLQENTLPHQFGTWHRESFKINENSSDHPMGRYSRAWRYVNGDQSAVASIFYSYPDWKEVTACYTARGWRVSNRVIHDAGSASETGPHVTARLYQPEYQRNGYLIFQNRDASGRPLTLPAKELRELVWNRIAENPTWQTLTGATTVRDVNPTYLVQLFVECPVELDPIEEQSAEALFQQMLRVLPK